MLKHTIVVEFPSGEPRYSADLEALGGHIVSVDRGGDRLKVLDDLHVALQFIANSGELSEEAQAVANDALQVANRAERE